MGIAGVSRIIQFLGLGFWVLFYDVFMDGGLVVARLFFFLCCFWGWNIRRSFEGHFVCFWRFSLLYFPLAWPRFHNELVGD